MMSGITELNTSIFFALHAWVGLSPWLDAAILFFAKQADLYVVAGAMLFMLIHQHGKSLRTGHTLGMSFVRELVLITCSVLAAWFVTFLLKSSIGGMRPFEFYNTVKPLFMYGGGDTFPSGHATLFAALAMMLTLLHRHAGIIFVILALLISIARVIAGIHFPLDVLVGWIIGGGVSYISYLFLRKKMG